MEKQEETAKGQSMTGDSTERRSERRSITDQYYSAEFSMKKGVFVYQFKIWDISPKGICVLVKEGSDLLNQLKVGDILDLKYYRSDPLKSADHLKTQIGYITKDDTGRFKGVYLVGLSILENQDSER
jgi:hypothetical protein